MKLNLGSADYPLEGYQNIDVLPYEKVDLVADVYHLPCKDGSAEEIYAGHLLEHLSNPMDFFMECWRVLQPDGLLSIVVPDMTAAARHPEWALAMLFGFRPNQDQPDIVSKASLHRSWWNRDLLLAVAEQCGFRPLGDIDNWKDPRLVAGAGWQTGIDFRKGKMNPLASLGASHYRQIFDRI